MPYNFEDNLLRFIREANVFNRPQMNAGNDLDGYDLAVEDTYDPRMRMRELYQPDTRMSDQYMQAIADMPVREKPGRMATIAGNILTALGQPGYADHVMYRGYNQKMDDWSNKIKPLQDGANIERQNNANMRIAANSIMSGEMADRRLDRQYQRDKVLRDQGQSRIDLATRNAEESGKRADARLKLAEMVARGGQFEVDDDGVARVRYRDGSYELVDGNYLSEEEKLQARQRYRSTGAGRRDRVTKEVRINPVTGQPELGSFNLDTGEFTPATTKGDKTKAPVTPGNREREESSSARELGAMRGELRRAREAKASNSKWAKYIKIKGNTYEIQRPGMFSGPDEATYNEIGKYIKGDAESSAMKPPKPGYVKVRRKSDGKTGDWPQGTPIPAEYEAVK